MPNVTPLTELLQLGLRLISIFLRSNWAHGPTASFVAISETQKVDTPLLVVVLGLVTEYGLELAPVGRMQLQKGKVLSSMITGP